VEEVAADREGVFLPVETRSVVQVTEKIGIYQDLLAALCANVADGHMLKLLQIRELALSLDSLGVVGFAQLDRWVVWVADLGLLDVCL